VLSLGLTNEEVIRPEGSVGSLASYLATLKDEDPVRVVSQASKHGLAGKASNGASSKERALFVEFVKEYRSPTGRTQDHTGRYHGAEYYLTSKLTTIKTQSGRNTADPDAVLECVFKKALLGRADAAKLKPPSGTTVLSWLKEDFGINSEHGHTALFPHKSDACSICSSFDVDIDSIKMSIKRHEQQTSDAGSIERQARSPRLRLALGALSPQEARTRDAPPPSVAPWRSGKAPPLARKRAATPQISSRPSTWCYPPTRRTRCRARHARKLTLTLTLTKPRPPPWCQAALTELREQLKDLEEARATHKSEATDAQDAYKRRIKGQRDEYLAVCAAHAAYIESPSFAALNAIIACALAFSFGIDSDYQMDKPTPFWGKSPQPGPTYFYSKETNYLHIAVVHACGDADGPTRLDRSHCYIRSQQCAGSKDCNDTVFTLFNLLSSPTAVACPQPKLCRRGYDSMGAAASGQTRAPPPHSSSPHPTRMQAPRSRANGSPTLIQICGY